MIAAAALLARAENFDPSLDNLVTVVTCAGIALGVGVVAMVPVLVAWSRRHERADRIIALSIVWAAVTIVSVASALLEEMKYSHEHLLQIQSGYWDPNDVSDAPDFRPKMVLWAILAFVYFAMLAWPMLRRPAQADPPSAG